MIHFPFSTKACCFFRSAYVEFMRKEAADNALSLDGTSFMSRILKVIIISEFFSCSLTFSGPFLASFVITPLTSCFICFSVSLCVHLH